MTCAMHTQVTSYSVLSSFQDIPFTFQLLQPHFHYILCSSARKAIGNFSHVITTVFGLGLGADF